MKRRNFIQFVFPAGLTSGLLSHAFLSHATTQGQSGNTVIVKGGLPHQRFLRGIDAYGGISRLVKKGQHVVVKPAMAFNQPAGSGCNSDPALIKEIIEKCYEAGAKAVSLFDHTIDEWTKCYKNSGIERVAKDAMARVLPANHEMFYSEVKSGKAGILKTVKIHDALSKADVFINVAVARSGRDGGFSGAVENLAGCIWGRRHILNPGDVRELADLLYYLKPGLTILDYYQGRETNGSSQNFQIISDDCVAADSVALQLLNRNPEHSVYLEIADKLGLGNNRVNISQIPVL